MGNEVLKLQVFIAKLAISPSPLQFLSNIFSTSLSTSPMLLIVLFSWCLGACVYVVVSVCLWEAEVEGKAAGLVKIPQTIAFPLILLSRYVRILVLLARVFLLYIHLNNFLAFSLETIAVGVPHDVLPDINLPSFLCIVFVCEFLFLGSQWLINALLLCFIRADLPSV